MTARIETINYEQADDKLRESYDKYGGENVANIIKVHSLFPASLEAHLQFYKTIMFGKSPLSRAQREMIATAVSVKNNCHY